MFTAFYEHAEVEDEAEVEVGEVMPRRVVAAGTLPVAAAEVAIEVRAAVEAAADEAAAEDPNQDIPVAELLLSLCLSQRQFYLLHHRNLARRAMLSSIDGYRNLDPEWPESSTRPLKLLFLASVLSWMILAYVA